MLYHQFIDGFNQAYEHRGGLTMFAIGRIDGAWFQQIRSEVTWIVGSQYSSDVTNSSHVTYWTRPRGTARQFSLLNKTGKSDDFSTDHSMELEGKKLTFPQLAATARFARLFGPNLVNLRLNGLGKNSGLGAHEECPVKAFPNGSLKYKIRFHLPIFTNPDAAILLDGQRFHFEESVLYFFNQSCVHSAVNEGEEPRYHFVLDCLLDRSLQRNLLSLSGEPLADKGLRMFSAAESKLYTRAEPWKVEEFVTQSGRKMTRLDYGRQRVGRLDYYFSQHPRLFNKLRSSFGLKPRDLEL